MSRLDAPWTPQQVAALNAYQAAGIMHPYTCDGKRHISRRRCRRVLVATTNGWRCTRRGCRYKQAWAHDWTAEPWLLEFRTEFEEALAEATVNALADLHGPFTGLIRPLGLNSGEVETEADDA